MPPRVSTGDRDAELRQIRWCAAVQTLVNSHCQLEENPVGNVEPMQLVVQYLTQAAFKLANLAKTAEPIAMPIVGTDSCGPIDVLNESPPCEYDRTIRARR